MDAAVQIHRSTRSWRHRCPGLLQDRCFPSYMVLGGTPGYESDLGAAAGHLCLQLLVDLCIWTAASTDQWTSTSDHHSG